MSPPELRGADAAHSHIGCRPSASLGRRAPSRARSRRGVALAARPAARHCTRKYKLSVSYMRGYHDRGLDRIKNTICTQYRIKQAYQNAGCKHLARSPGRLPSRKAAHERRYARWLSPPAISMLALSNGTRISLSGRAAPITLSESRVAAPSLLVSAWRPPAHARRLQMETAPPPVDSGAQRGWRRGVRSAR